MPSSDKQRATHFNDLTPAQAERLALLLEELGESQQAIGKILRHGYESHHPDGGPSNRVNLVRELAQVIASIDLMVGAKDFNPQTLQKFREEKHEKVRQYLHHQEGERHDWRFPI
jgi:hypothetical protein